MTSLAVAVVGARVARPAAAWALSKRGARVSVFDQHAEGHAEGASHGATRLNRLAYFEKPDYAPLLQRAHDGWRALERSVGEVIFLETGLVEAGPADGALVSGVLRAAAAHGLAVEEMSPAAAGELCGARLPATWRALVERRAGYLRAEAAMKAFRALARANGAAFGWSEAVTGVKPGDQRLRLATTRRRIDVDRIVLAPGPWANQLFADLGLAAPCRVEPREKVWRWFATRGERAALPFALETRPGEIFYGVPSLKDASVKLGAHHGGAPLVKPEQRQHQCEEERAAIAAFAREFLPTLETEAAREAACLYEMSPDGDFAIDSAAEDPRIAFAIGLSGHGFKFAPVIGEALADIALNADRPQDMAFLSAGRFPSNAATPRPAC